MDDYNVNVLSEAKSEYSSRLVTIMTPLMLEGIKSIFNEAIKLCLDNDEEQKYLMTFQNFLSRVPKWNETIIDIETKRIIEKSRCDYLEDLLTCVHITQLKILTSIRVSQKQKKIDIDIPKLATFVHKCYIAYARKLYSNVYLFEKDILPLNYQKNMREAELMCQESILQVIRENMPVEKILRAYIDETVDEEVIEETIEKTVDEAVKKAMEEEAAAAEKLENKMEENGVTKNQDTMELEKPKLESAPEKVVEEQAGIIDKTKNDNTSKEHNINLVIETPTIAENNESQLVKELPKKEIPVVRAVPIKKGEVVNRLKFNDKDSVLDMVTNKSSEIEAPKTLERLEKIAKENNDRRKAEEAAYDDEDDEDEEKLRIFDDANLVLDKIDVHNLNKKMNLKPDPILEDIEVLG
tara:strand:- start:1659 stop:2888 length:1230 start_codon:yes stop_codon:yes gene_type:complete